MTFSEGTEKITEGMNGSTAKSILAWITPLMLAGFAFLAPSWLDKHVDDRVAPLEAHIAMTDQRLAVIDSTMSRGRQDREAFQIETKQTLTSMQVMMVKTAEAIATLTATIAQMQRPGH